MSFSIFPRSSKIKRNKQNPPPVTPKPAAYQPRHSERDAKSCIPLSQRPKPEQNKFKHVSLGDDPTLSKGKRNGMFLGRSKGKGKVLEGSSSSGSRSLVSGLEEVPEEELSGYEAGSSGEPAGSRGSGDGLPGSSSKGRREEDGFKIDFDAYIDLPKDDEDSGASVQGGGVSLAPPNLPERGPVPTLPPVVAIDTSHSSSEFAGKPYMDHERRDTRATSVPDVDRMAEIYDTAVRDRNRSLTYQILDGTATSSPVDDPVEERRIPLLHGLRREKRYWSHRNCIPKPGERVSMGGMMPQLESLRNSPAGAPPTRARTPLVQSRWSSSASPSAGETERSDNGSQVSVPAVVEVKSVRIRVFQGVKRLWL